MINPSDIVRMHDECDGAAAEVARASAGLRSQGIHLSAQTQRDLRRAFNIRLAFVGLDDDVVPAGALDKAIEYGARAFGCSPKDLPRLSDNPTPQAKTDIDGYLRSGLGELLGHLNRLRHARSGILPGITHGEADRLALQDTTQFLRGLTDYLVSVASELAQGVGDSGPTPGGGPTQSSAAGRSTSTAPTSLY